MIKGKLLRFLNEIVQRELTGDEIKEQLGYSPILYSDLATINNVDELLRRGNGTSIIILYQETQYSGHYTLLYKRGAAICFFDPYGMAYDTELKRLSMKQAAHLSRILQGTNCTSNRFPIQKYGTKIQDCGSHCITRLRLRHLTDEQYALLLKENEQIISADQLMLLMNMLTVYYRDTETLS